MARERSATVSGGEKLVLLHGIARTKFSMWGIARHLKPSGYEVLNLGYPSRHFRLEQLVEYIHPRIREFAAGAPVHFVVHSMGGLLVRAYLTRYPETKIGRVVMLGTPNHGSEVADYMKDWRLYRWIFGPAGQQLVTHQQGISQLFGPVNFPLGIIAGNTTIDVFCSRIIGQTNDGKVSVESTKLQGMEAHIVLPVSHLGMLHSRSVRAHIVRFLKTGAF